MSLKDEGKRDVKSKSGKYVLLPSTIELRYLRLCGYEDYMPKSNHYVPEAWKELDGRVYDPVIIVDGAEMCLALYGASLEFDRAKRQFEEVRANPFGYKYIVTFTIYKDWVLKKFAKYSTVWGALAELKLLIDAKDWATASDPRIIKAPDWLKMSDEQRLQILRAALGDEGQAKIALEYRRPPRRGAQIAFTGIHLTEEEPYGVVLVLSIEKLFPITEDQIAGAVGERKHLPGWLRTPRLISEDIGNALIALAPIVLTRDTIESFCRER